MQPHSCIRRLLIAGFDMTEKTFPSQKNLLAGWASGLPKTHPWHALAVFRNKDLWSGLLLTGVFAAALALVQFATPSLVGNDGYYHIKMAYLLRTEGFKPAFEWLPLTVLNPQEYYDHHYLFHILMIPFTFGDLRLGAKLASVLFPALAFASVWWLLKSQRVPYSGLWSVGLLAISEAFLYRMSMPRAQSLSLLLLIWTLHWLLTARYGRLVALGFVYVWAYNAFPLILSVVAAYVAARWLIDKEIHWQPLAYAAAGVALGLLLNPYFPENLVFIYRHLAPKLGDATAVPVGNEWYPYTTATLMENSGGALLIFLVGILALGLSGRRMHTAAATGLFLVMGFGWMLFESRRFVEYAPPFMLIFAALACKPLLEAWAGTRQASQNLETYAAIPRPRGSAWLWPALALVLLVPLLWLNLSAARKALQEAAKPYPVYAQASAWLAANSPAGSRVFQTDWDDFPRLFFYNHHNTYTIGLDPTYMQLFDADLYERWVSISQGEVDNPGAAIRDEFESAYVLSDLNHKDFLRAAAQDGQLVQVYADEYAVVFQVIAE